MSDDNKSITIKGGCKLESIRFFHVPGSADGCLSQPSIHESDIERRLGEVITEATRRAREGGLLAIQQEPIPVTERLPEDGEPVLVYDGVWRVTCDVIEGVTHWLPLPLPPKPE